MNRKNKLRDTCKNQILECLQEEKNIESMKF